MSFRSILRTILGQRIDKPDFDHVAERSGDAAEAVGRELLTGSDTPETGYVLEGFGASAVGTIITVARGVALVGRREGGEVIQGGMITSGATPATRAIDISAYSDGTYGIYIRLEFVDAAFANRAVWDAQATTPGERTENVATRRHESWGLTVELVSPGTEWLRIATVAKAGSTLTITDRRPFYFEGDPANDHITQDAEWGNANDHNNDRATYGVRSLRTFVRAMTRKIEEIQGGTATEGWWLELGDIGAAPLRFLTTEVAALNVDTLPRDGTRSATGTILPSPTNAIDLGTAVNVWRRLYATFVRAGTFEFTAAQTFYAYVPVMSSFIFTDPTEFGTDAATGYLFKDATTATQTAFADVRLPHNATITNVRVVYTQNAGATLTLALRRYAANDFFGTMRSAGSVTFTNGAVATVDVVPDQNNVVDSELHRLRLHFTVNANAATASVISIRITYTLANVTMGG